MGTRQCTIACREKRGQTTVALNAHALMFHACRCWGNKPNCTLTSIIALISYLCTHPKIREVVHAFSAISLLSAAAAVSCFAFAVHSKLFFHVHSLTCLLSFSLMHSEAPGSFWILGCPLWCPFWSDAGPKLLFSCIYRATWGKFVHRVILLLDISDENKNFKFCWCNF